MILSKNKAFRASTLPHKNHQRLQWWNDLQNPTHGFHSHAPPLPLPHPIFSSPLPLPLLTRRPMTNRGSNPSLTYPAWAELRCGMDHGGLGGGSCAEDGCYKKCLLKLAGLVARTVPSPLPHLSHPLPLLPPSTPPKKKATQNRLTLRRKKSITQPYPHTQKCYKIYYRVDGIHVCKFRFVTTGLYSSTYWIFPTFDGVWIALPKSSAYACGIKAQRPWSSPHMMHVHITISLAYL